MKVRLIAKTVICDEDLKNELGFIGPQNLIMYCARVSNPNNQTSTNTKLLDYCLKHGHVSIFEMANMVFEIETSRAIAAQILRHRSFSFQEFSQRYAAVQNIEVYEARSQDPKNRQNSNDDMEEHDKAWFKWLQEEHNKECIRKYKEALARGVAKEQARFLLPLATSTKLYMNGSIRSWIHYLQLRCGNGTQKEHQEIAMAIREIFVKELPVIGEALGWIPKTQD
ncbi:MAG: FAD-dependent thymidylate synthase [Proteobacteria bacterium SG_bin7]|nr:MAG: FAD-dependent thymidylate synthase [Proteobacteria bacterium SG_bin7]